MNKACATCNEQASYTLFHRDGSESYICGACPRPEDIRSIAKIGLEGKTDNQYRVQVRNDWLDYLKSPEGQEMRRLEEEAYESHWVHDMLDAPEALISVLETKNARAVIGMHRTTKKRIVELIKAHVRQPDATAGGFLAVCTCGAAFDEITDHHIDLIEELEID